jgi:hypothetical protein
MLATIMWERRPALRFEVAVGIFDAYTPGPKFLASSMALYRYSAQL